MSLDLERFRVGSLPSLYYIPEAVSVQEEERLLREIRASKQAWKVVSGKAACMQQCLPCYLSAQLATRGSRPGAVEESSARTPLALPRAACCGTAAGVAGVWLKASRPCLSPIVARCRPPATKLGRYCAQKGLNCLALAGLAAAAAGATSGGDWHLGGRLWGAAAAQPRTRQCIPGASSCTVCPLCLPPDTVLGKSRMKKVQVM